MKHGLKKIVATALTASMIWAAPQQTQGMPLLLGICIVAAAGGAIAGVAVCVKSCQIKWYCLWDEENQLKVTKQITKKAAGIEGLQVLFGPFDTEKEAIKMCVTNNIPVPARTAYVDPGFFIEESTNLVHWTVAANLTGQDPEDFSWSVTNRFYGTRFYRVKIVEHNESPHEIR